MSTTPNSTLADCQQLVADLQRELAECRAERDEALEYQTATSDVLNVISRSAFDLQAVLDTVVETAGRLCGADSGGITIREGEVYRYVSAFALDAEHWAILRQRTIVPGRDSITARTVLEGRVVHVADSRADPDYAQPETVAAGIRTQLGVPLLREGAVLGTIGLGRKRVEPYTERQIELVRTFAAQAVIAIENARLLGELQQRTEELAVRDSEFGERIEHQSATIDVLKAMSASPSDPQPVFDLIVRRARDLCNATVAGLFEFDGELVHFRAQVGHEAYGTPDALEAYERLFPMVPTRGSISCRAILDRQTIHVRDMASEPGVSAAVLNLGQKSQISLPLLRDGAAIGAIAMASEEIGGFTDSQVALLQTFAEQAVIAITSAETYRQLQQRTGDLQESLEYQTATSDVLKVISRSTADLQPVLDTVIETAVRLCGADSGNIAIRQGEVYRPVASSASAAEPELWATMRQRAIVPGRDSVHARVALEGTVVHVEDVLADPDYAWPETVASGRRTSLGVPLLREGAVLGTIALSRKRVEPFTERQIELVRTFADQAVIAMENARLLGELQARTAELAERNTAFAERIDHQAATIDVLKEMSASPADALPVFDLICDQARALLGTLTVAIFEYDGTLVHRRTGSRSASFADPTARAAYDAGWPRVPDRGSNTCRAILDGTIIHIRDMDAEPGVSAEVRALGSKTQVVIPLMRDGRAIGAITTASQRVDSVSDTQIELLNAFAEQAVIAIQSAETWRELQARTRDLEESLEYQTATSEVLKVISRSTFDLQPVLDTLLEIAARLCDSEMAGLTIREGDVFRIVATRSLDPGYDSLLRARTFAPGRETLAGRVALTGEVVHIPDITADPDYRLPEAATIGKIRSNLGVPLLRDGSVVGTLTLARERVEPFTERQIELVRTFADQAVIAMENARLLGELQARTRDLEESLEYQTATSDVLNVISRSTADVQPVLDTVVETAARLCGNDTATILIREGEVYGWVANYGIEPEFWAALRRQTVAPGRDSVVGRVALEGRVVHVADILADPDYAHSVSVASGRRTTLGVPLLREGAVLGMISLARKQVQPFTERQIELVRTFADQAVIAMENARLLGELQARTRDLEESLEYQTATSDVLNVISRSTADVTPVLDTLLKAAARLCGVDAGAIAIREGDVYRYPVPGLSGSIAAGRTLVPGRNSVAGRAVLEGRVVHIADVQDIPDYAFPESGGLARTSLGVPLLRDGEPIGVITLNRKYVEPFSERQINLIRTFADQAVIAIENARLLSELQARTRDLEESLEYQTATSDVLKVISRSTADVQPVLDTVAETAGRLCGADYAAISVRKGEVYRFVARSTNAADLEHWAALRQRTIVPGRQSVMGQVALEGKVVHVADIRSIPDYAVPEGVAAGDRTVLGVPLLREGEVLGVIGLVRKRVQPYAERQIELVRTFADQAVIAMENARLLGELQARTRDLEESLEYQTATSDVLNVISRSTADVQPVLDT
jgi:two-component system, NtrC family, sensor kinase